MDQMFSLRICRFSIRITLTWGQLRNSRHQRKSQYSVFLPKSRTEIYLSKGVPPPFFRRGQWPSNTEDNSTLLVEIAPTLVCIINHTKQHLSFISFPHIFTFLTVYCPTLRSPAPFFLILSPVHNSLPFVKMIYGSQTYHIFGFSLHFVWRPHIHNKPFSANLSVAILICRL